MKYKSILYNWKFRISFAVTSGIFFKLMVDIIFGLIYRNYQILKPWDTYIGVVITTVVVVECFFLVTKKLDIHIHWDDKPKRRFIKQILYHIAIIFFFFGLVRWTIEYLFADDYFVVIKNEIIIILSTFVIAILFNLFELGLFLLYKWRFSLAEIERFKKENAEFQFEVLRNQVNPHFLFNSLNTLSSLMYENVDTAANYIRRLSEVYRYVLEHKQKDLITLDKEIHFIESYKYLFELRFTDRIQFDINIQDYAMNWFIAPLTLQMLIENAVKHNIINAKKPLTISIHTSEDYIVVTNNLQLKTTEEFSSGMGLKNIISQYAYLTNTPVIIDKNADAFIVKVPLIENKKLQND